MRKYEPYDMFARRFAKEYMPQREPFHLEGQLDACEWGRFVRAGLSMRDVRLCGGELPFWTRAETTSGMQVIAGWRKDGKLGMWSVPLNDCGALTGIRGQYCARELDVWRFVRTMDALSRELRETAITKTVRALCLHDFEGIPDAFNVGVVSGSSSSVANGLMAIMESDEAFDELTKDDAEEVCIWKLTLLLLTAALGGDASAQRETAWRLDPGNDAPTRFRRDADLAAYWYLMAAKRGDGLAANNLASYYGDHHDCAKALRWYCVAAKAGIPEGIRGKSRCEKCREESCAGR